MKTVLCLTGQPYSIKFGGLERWYERNAQLGSGKFRFLLAFLEEVPTKEIVQRFSDSGVACICFDPKREGLRAYKALLKREKVDIVHCHFDNSAFYLIPSKIWGKKTFWTFHMGNYYVENPSWKSHRNARIGVAWYKQKFRWLGAFVDKIFFVSDNVRLQHQRFYGFPPKKCQTMYLGTDVEQSKYAPNKEHNLVPQISTIGFLDDIKGIDLLLQALKILSDKQVAFAAQIIGTPLVKEGPNKYVALAKALGIEDKVQFLGNRSDIYELLNASDIYCQPSRSEALPFTVMEAMQCALPVVASRVGGIPELIEHGKEGFLSTAGDTVALALHLQQLLSDANLRRQMGAAALHAIRQDKFSMDKNILELHKIYSS